MKIFFELNRYKLLVCFALSFVIMAALFSIISFMGYRAGQFTTETVIIFSIITPLGIALFISVLIPVRWYINRKKRNEIFQIATLEQLGFRDCYFNERSSLTITEISKAAQFDGYTILLNIPEPRERLTGVLQFTPMVKKKKLTNQQVKALWTDFGIYRSVSFEKTLSRIYRIEVIRTMPADDLKDELHNMAKVFKNENFEPDEEAVRWI